MLCRLGSAHDRPGRGRGGAGVPPRRRARGLHLHRGRALPPHRPPRPQHRAQVTSRLSILFIFARFLHMLTAAYCQAAAAGAGSANPGRGVLLLRPEQERDRKNK